MAAMPSVRVNLLRPPKRIVLRLLAALACAACAGAALAQPYPVKPIRFVIGPAPDLLPRLVGQRLSEHWGQQIVVDQRPGAGGAIAAELVARAAPDGYTWLMSTGSFYVLEVLQPKLPYKMLRDIGQVTLMATLPFIAVVHPSVPAKNLSDLVRIAKASPGKLNFASAGVGTTTQLAAELFKQSAQIDIVHVPYKSVAFAVADVLSGQAQLMFSIAQGAVPHVQSGKLRALAITSRKRSAAVPEVPTMIEAGFADIDIVGWNGLAVPVKTPRALVTKLNSDVRRVLAQKDLQERMIAAGFDLADTTIDAFDAFVKKDIQLYERVVKAAGIRLD